MKYGGMAFQLFGACLLGALIGRWLDGWMQLERPLWAVFLTIFFMAAAIYAIYRQLLNDE
ncbi:MAG: AtpZ/AtpI family protein [Saprospiraceae bacterium]